MGTAKGDGYTVTPRDLELVVNAINCTRLPFEIDYDKLARRLGYKNAQSAKAAWNALKRKLDKVAEGAPVVPSLTIEPEPLRRLADSPKPESSRSKKSKDKQPVVESPSASSDDDSGTESDRPTPPKRSKRRKHAPAPAVDQDGDLPMAGHRDPTGAKAKSKAKASSSKRKHAGSEGQKRRRVAVSSSSTSSSETSSDSEAAIREAEVPPRKLKRKLADRSKQGSSGAKGKSVEQRHHEAFAAREKAFEAFGVRDAVGNSEDEDDEEVHVGAPPPPYVKRESGSEGVGASPSQG